MIEYQELLFKDEAELISHLKFVNNELLDKVANQEKLLAELEIKYDKQSTDLYNAENISSDLQQQLSDKEKELVNYKLCRCVDCTTENEKALENIIEELRKENYKYQQLYFLELHNHDRHKFAIEELEKVKEYVNKHKYKIDYGRYVVYRKSLVNEIDYQIKELKAGSHEQKCEDSTK